MSSRRGIISLAGFEETPQLGLSPKRSKGTIDRELDVVLLRSVFELHVVVQAIERDLFHLCAKPDDVHQELWTEVLTLSPARVRTFLIGPLAGEIQIGAAVFQVRHSGPAVLFSHFHLAFRDLY